MRAHRYDRIFAAGERRHGQTSKIERSSGNVFIDLGFPKAEAKNLMLRCQLMFEISEIARSMTHAKAVLRLGITHSRLNDLLLRGRIDRFSLDALVNMATSAGLHVRLEIASP